MRTLPAAIPVTTPEDEPTFAIAVLLLLHAPEPGQYNGINCPTHTDEAPVTGEGRGFTVML